MQFLLVFLQTANNSGFSKVCLEKQHDCTLQHSTLACACESSRTQLVLTNGAQILATQVVTQSQIKLRQKHCSATQCQRGNSSSEAADGIKLLPSRPQSPARPAGVAAISSVLCPWSLTDGLCVGLRHVVCSIILSAGLFNLAECVSVSCCFSRRVAEQQAPTETTRQHNTQCASTGQSLPQ